MIERIAIALWQRHHRLTGKNLAMNGFEDQARCVLAAMREPTEAMVEVVTENGVATGCCLIGRDPAIEAWQMMIDAALGEG